MQAGKRLTICPWLFGSLDDWYECDIRVTLRRISGHSQNARGFGRGRLSFVAMCAKGAKQQSRRLGQDG